MEKENNLQAKSFSYAVEIVQLCRNLQEDKEYVLSRQLLRSGTAVGTLVEEAIGGQSSKDFYHKLTITYKEARETKYWLKLLRESSYLSIERSEVYLEMIEELLKIPGSIRITMQKKLGH